MQTKNKIPVPLSHEAKKTLIAEKMGEILTILGLDLTDPSLAKTPYRVAQMYVDEVFKGLDPENFPQISFQDEECQKELVLVRNISFVSFCEHHLVPIVGKAHIAYFPRTKILGLSKIPRIVQHFAKRPQLQERLNQQIAGALTSILDTEDVAVSLQAIHLCVLARGVKDQTAEMHTHVLKGRFENDITLRSEFFSQIFSKDFQMLSF